MADSPQSDRDSWFAKSIAWEVDNTIKALPLLAVAALITRFSGLSLTTVAIVALGLAVGFRALVSVWEKLRSRL